MSKSNHLPIALGPSGISSPPNAWRLRSHWFYSHRVWTVFAQYNGEEGQERTKWRQGKWCHSIVLVEMGIYDFKKLHINLFSVDFIQTSTYLFCRHAVLLIYDRRQGFKWPLLCWVSSTCPSANSSKNVVINIASHFQFSLQVSVTFLKHA